MNFGFDEDQVSLGDTVARLLADHAALLAPEPPAQAQQAAWDALAELGLFALLVPEASGGAGLGLVDVALAVEALGAGLAPPAAAATLAATDVLVRHGSAAQQQAWLGRIAAGEARFAIAEVEAGQGECSFAGGTLNGSKLLVAQGESADALLVLARGPSGPALVLVERDAPGVSITPHEDIDPSSQLCAVRFDHVRLDVRATVGGADAVERLFDVSATLAAAMQVGIAARMLDTAVEYARTRVQFGQEIGAFQAIKHRCADMAVAIEAARSASYFAWWAVDENAPERARAVSMAKVTAGETSRMVCNETIQVHGGMGFTWELGLHRFMRRSRVLEYAFGDAAWHNERIVAETMAQLLAGRAIPRSVLAASA